MASIPGLAGPGAGYPQWTVILTNAAGGNTGVVGKVDNALEKTAVETVSWPSKVLFFTSQQAAQNYINSNGGAVSKPLQQIASAGQRATNAVTGATTSVADFLTRLERPGLWLRVAEAVAGLMLIALGINAILHNPAGKTVSAAAAWWP